MTGDTVAHAIDSAYQSRPLERLRFSAKWLWMAAGAAIAITCIVGISVSAQVYSVDAAAAIGLNVLHAAAIGVGLLRPRLAAAMGIAAAFSLMALGANGVGTWPWAVPWLLQHLALLFVVAVRAPWRTTAATWLISAGGSLLLAWLLRDERDLGPAISSVVLYTSLAAATLAAGIGLAELIQTRDRLRREREVSASEHAERTLAQQRARIARDLHDVIAHSMSIISIQASSAPARLGPLEPQLVDEFDQIADSARRALSEMRQVLTVLRSEGESSSLAPAPGLNDIRELVEQARQAGLDVHLDWPADPPTGELLGLAVYRIVQEAMSNAVRHAPGSQVGVTGQVSPHAFNLSITNTRSPLAQQVTDPDGLGIIGMRERAKAAGGTLHAAPTSEGGYVVHAVLPITPQPGHV